MSKKWSSFSEQQLLTENWRKFLAEEVVELDESEEEIQERFRGKGGYVDRFKQSSKAFSDKWKETRPVPMVDYPATELVTILNMVYQAAGLTTDDDQKTKDEIVREVEALLKAQNFVVKEEINGGKLMLGQKLVLDLTKTLTLARVLTQIKTSNPDAHNKIMSAFRRGGFKIGPVSPAPQPTTQQTQTRDEPEEPAAVTAVPTPQDEPEQRPSGDEAEKSKNIRVSPTEYFSKMNLVYTNPEDDKKYSLRRLALKMAKALNSDLGLNERREQKEFYNVVKFFNTIENRGIKVVLFKALVEYLKATTFQIGSDTRDALKYSIDSRSPDPGPPNKAHTPDSDFSDIIADKGQDKPGPDPDAVKNFDDMTGVPITDEGRDQIVNKMITTNNAGDFMDLYDTLGKSSFGKDKHSIEKLMSSVGELSDYKKEKNLNFTDMQKNIDKSIIAYISSFGSDKRQQIRDKFRELIIKPIFVDDDTPDPSVNVPDDSSAGDEDDSSAKQDSADSSETDTTSSVDDSNKEAETEDTQDDESQEETTPENIIRKDLRSALKDEKEQKEFDEQFPKFIEELRELVGTIAEINQQKDVFGAIGIKGTKNKDKQTRYKEIIKKYPKVKKALQMYQPDSEEKQRFLNNFAKLIKSPPVSTGITDDTPEPEVAPDEAPEPEVAPEAEAEEPSEEKSEQKYEFKPIFKNYDEMKNIIRNDRSKFYFKGSSGRKYGFRRDIFIVKQINYDSDNVQEAFEAWEELYNNENQNKKDNVKAYLVGLKRFIENNAGQKSAPEFGSTSLNESIMLRWKKIAGIL